MANCSYCLAVRGRCGPCSPDQSTVNIEVTAGGSTARCKFSRAELASRGAVVLLDINAAEAPEGRGDQWKQLADVVEIHAQWLDGEGQILKSESRKLSRMHDLKLFAGDVILTVHRVTLETVGGCSSPSMMNSRPACSPSQRRVGGEWCSCSTRSLAIQTDAPVREKASQACSTDFDFDFLSAGDLGLRSKLEEAEEAAARSQSRVSELARELCEARQTLSSVATTAQCSEDLEELRCARQKLKDLTALVTVQCYRNSQLSRQLDAVPELFSTVETRYEELVEENTSLHRFLSAMHPAGEQRTVDCFRAALDRASGAIEAQKHTIAKLSSSVTRLKRQRDQAIRILATMVDREDAFDTATHLSKLRQRDAVQSNVMRGILNQGLDDSGRHLLGHLDDQISQLWSAIDAELCFGGSVHISDRSE